MRLFASYSRKDAAAVGAIVDELQALGHDAWLDTDDIRGGERWRHSIVEGVTACDATVLFLSPDSVISANVAREITVADELHKPILPVLLADCEVSQELQYQLAGLQRVDIRSRPPAEAATSIDRELRPDEAVPPAAAPRRPLPPPVAPAPDAAPAAGPFVAPAARRRNVVRAGFAVIALVGVAAVVATRRGGEGAQTLGATATNRSSATAVAAATAAPTAATLAGASGPAGAATTSTEGVGGLPAPVTFTDRTFWAGKAYSLFQVDLTSASVTASDATRWKVTVDARVRNYSTSAAYLETSQTSLVWGSQRADLWAASTGSIPGGETAEVSFSADVRPGFAWATAAVVVGNVTSNASTIPLDATRPVQTIAPIVGVGKGLSADGGAGLTVRILDGILWPDFTDGNKGAYWYDFLAEHSFETESRYDYEELRPQLRVPNGTTTVVDRSNIFTASEGGIVPNGASTRQGYHVAVRGGTVGSYTLTFDSRSVRVYKYPGAVDPTITFTVDR